MKSLTFSPVSRRAVIGGLAACSLPIGQADAQGVWSLLRIGLGVLSDLWSAYQIGQTIYDKIFTDSQKDGVISEVNNYNTTINQVEQYYGSDGSYLKFQNPYRDQYLNDIDPGIIMNPSGWADARTMFCGCRNGAIALSPGFVIGLSGILKELASRYERDNQWAYTRPVRYWEHAGPWESYGNQGFGWQKKTSYYTPNGSVAMRWYVPDSRTGIGRVEAKVKDSTSGNVLIEGESSTFRFAR